MAHVLTLREEPRYLHAIVTGTNSADAVSGYLSELLGECLARRYSRLLIEERLEGRRLDTLTVFKLVLEGIDRAQGRLRAIAYVDMNAGGDLMRFAEAVAVNRGLNVAVFSTLSDAQAWLARQP